MSSSTRSFRVFGLGQCCLDYAARVDTYPPPDTKYEFTDMVVEGGGPVGTALSALSRWGLSCAISGVVGDDAFGPLIRASLDREGIDTSGLLVRPGSGSQVALVLAEPVSGRRTIFWRRPTGDPPESHELEHDVIRRAQVFYTDGLFIEAAMAGARTARGAGVPVLVDAGSLRDGMLDLARTSDYFIVAEKFARELVGDEKPLDACRKLAELGPSVVGVTLGARGYVAIDRGKVIEKPAYKVRVVDTTGCGDVFHAGVAYGVVAGWEPGRGLDFGAWAAAMSSRELGGRSGIPRRGGYPG